MPVKKVEKEKHVEDVRKDSKKNAKKVHEKVVEKVVEAVKLVKEVTEVQAEDQTDHVKSDRQTVEAKGFKVKLPSVEDMLDSGVHFGHQARRWHPKMESYIFDKRKDIHILDLYKSHDLLENACKFLFNIAANGGTVIFVGTKKQARDIVELESKRCGVMFVTERWVGGTLTNFQTLKKNIDKLKDLIKKREAGELAHYTKKERLLIDREIERLRIMFGGLVNLKGKPDALFIVDVRKEKTAVREAARLAVPVVALVDTNSDPSGIKYVIPGNDDAIRSVALVVKSITDSIEAGYKKYADDVKKAEEDKIEAETKTKAKVQKEQEDILVTGTQSSELLQEAEKIEEKLLEEVEKELAPDVAAVKDELDKAKTAKEDASKKKKSKAAKK